MRIEIDQSGKIEKTNKPTVVAFSNKKFGTLIIPGYDKRQIQNLFRRTGATKIFMIKTFAALVCLLIRDHLDKNTQIIIDREYPGYDYLIKRFMIEFFIKMKIKIDIKSIHIISIGKGSQAHNLAIKSFRTKKADKKIKLKDILKILL